MRAQRSTSSRRNKHSPRAVRAAGFSLPVRRQIADRPLAHMAGTCGFRGREQELSRLFHAASSIRWTRHDFVFMPPVQVSGSLVSNGQSRLAKIRGKVGRVGRPPRWSDPFLAAVSLVYVQSVTWGFNDPVSQVQHFAGLSAAEARRVVDKARSKGFLPPTHRGKIPGLDVDTERVQRARRQAQRAARVFELRHERLQALLVRRQGIQLPEKLRAYLNELAAMPPEVPAVSSDRRRRRVYFKLIEAVDAWPAAFHFTNLAAHPLTCHWDTSHPRLELVKNENGRPQLKCPACGTTQGVPGWELSRRSGRAHD
jgi:hypothetical protein